MALIKIRYVIYNHYISKSLAKVLFILISKPVP